MKIIDLCTLSVESMQFMFLKLIKQFLVIQWLMSIGWLNEEKIILSVVINAHSWSKNHNCLSTHKLYVTFAYVATVEIQLFHPTKL